MIIFDKDNAAPNGSGNFELLEKGRYPAKVTKTQVKISKANNSYLSVTFEVMFNGKKHIIFDIVNDNDKDLTVKKNSCMINALPNVISNHAEFSLEDLGKVLMNKSMVINVDIQDQAEYGKRNIINVWDMPYSKIAEPAGTTAVEPSDKEPFFMSSEDASAPAPADNPYGADTY